ncbi:energy-coupling factor transporter transmembrane protein EcfT, partial [Bacillus cereus]|uniref:energy-coupling factor transporter transmembrane protein EcfT n=1 Tax=Bacillus cereus TaxID=1396 RepID=UPI0020C0AA29
NTVTYAMLLAFPLLIVLVSRLRPYFLINGLKPVLFLMAFSFLLHIFMTKEGVPVFESKFITIYDEGNRRGIFISVRFLVLVFM